MDGVASPVEGCPLVGMYNRLLTGFFFLVVSLTRRYFIPEDGDEEVHPNVFLAPKSRRQGVTPTLKAVRDAFPLPGHYHFRSNENLNAS